MNIAGSTIPLPWVVAATAVDLGFIGLCVLKIVAYSIEDTWLLRGNAQKLRADYLRSHHLDQRRTYKDELRVGRPRPFTRVSDVNAPSWTWTRAWGYVFKTPSVVILSSVLSVCFCAATPSVVSVVDASAIAGVVMVMLLTALTNRLVLGPLDQLNPDLGVSNAATGLLYPSASALGRYVLVLIVTSAVGFTAIYCSISHASSAAFTEGQSIDPIRWLYFTVTVASTVGFGDIHATSNLGRVFVLLQLAGGGLFLSWAASSFFGEGLPPRDPTVSRYRHRSKRRG